MADRVKGCPHTLMTEHSPYQRIALSPETGLVYQSLVGDEATGSEAAQIVARAPSLEEAALALSLLVADVAPDLPPESLYAGLLATALSRVDWPALALAWQVEDDHSLLRSTAQPPAPTPQAPVTHSLVAGGSC